MRKGFTFIELLIVIAIIGMLSTFFINTQGSASKRARDTQRKSDTKQYQNATETYASKSNGLYPSRTSATRASTTLCTDLAITTTCPEDPLFTKDPSFVYNYETDGGGTGTADATQYVLWAKLEATKEYWVICSNGKSGTMAQSGFGVSGGTCPLP